jgi:hypothetical protein
MSFIVENKVLFRKLVVAMFVISMLGPWAFDRLGVPAQFPCGYPNVRLNGDFCGAPFSGFRGLIWAIRDFFFILYDLIKWHIVVQSPPELITSVSMWIIALPIFSTLLLIRYPNSQRVQIINLAAWGTACFPALRFFILQTSRDQFVHLYYLLWGAWLYILVAIGTIIFEVLALRSHTKQNMEL